MFSEEVMQAQEMAMQIKKQEESVVGSIDEAHRREANLAARNQLAEEVFVEQIKLVYDEEKLQAELAERLYHTEESLAQVHG